MLSGCVIRVNEHSVESPSREVVGSFPPGPASPSGLQHGWMKMRFDPKLEDYRKQIQPYFILAGLDLRRVLNPRALRSRPHRHGRRR